MISLELKFSRKKVPGQKIKPSQEKRLWTFLAVENQKIAAHDSPGFQSSMIGVVTVTTLSMQQQVSAVMNGLDWP